MSEAGHEPKDWKIFHGDQDRQPHNGLAELPSPPPWRFARKWCKPECPKELISCDAEAARAIPFLTNPSMVIAVNAALYLRRPLLLSGGPGTGKSTLISKVSHELRLGPVIRWPIDSRSSVRHGVYEYDAVGRLQAGKDVAPPVEDYLTLGPLGTALHATTWPRPLLIDEIDKSDIDFANDLLNVIEEGVYEIPELRRLNKEEAQIRDVFGKAITINSGRIESKQFPFVVMTSNSEREFPPAFLRRCVRLQIKSPSPEELTRIVKSHLAKYRDVLKESDVEEVVGEFMRIKGSDNVVATDQLLNALFLTVAIRDAEERTFQSSEIQDLKKNLFQPLSA